MVILHICLSWVDVRFDHVGLCGTCFDLVIYHGKHCPTPCDNAESASVGLC